MALDTLTKVLNHYEDFDKLFTCLEQLNITSSKNTFARLHQTIWDYTLTWYS